MDQRHGEFVVRENSWPSHITPRAVSETEHGFVETGTGQTGTTP